MRGDRIGPSARQVDDRDEGVAAEDPENGLLFGGEGRWPSDEQVGCLVGARPVAGHPSEVLGIGFVELLGRMPAGPPTALTRVLNA